MLLLWVPVLLLLLLFHLRISGLKSSTLSCFFHHCFLVDFLLLFLQLFVIPIKKSSENSLYSVCHIQMWFVLDICFLWSFIWFCYWPMFEERKEEQKEGMKVKERARKERRKEFWKIPKFPKSGHSGLCLAAFRGCWLASISEK